MNKKQIRPFGVKDEIGYVFGDMAGSFVNLFVDAYFLIFCTNVLGISAGWMGTLFLVARLWDAINDPIMESPEINSNHGLRFLCFHWHYLVCFAFLMFHWKGLHFMLM